MTSNFVRKKMKELDNMENLEFFSEQGEYLMTMYNLDDFLKCNATKKILQEEHCYNFDKYMEPKILHFYNIMKNESFIDNSNLFKKDKGGDAEGELITIIYNNLKKKYDLNIFYNNPELASPLIEMEKENKK